ELLCAAQGIDLRRPLATSPALAEAMAEVRGVAEFFENDRQVAPDIEAVAARIGAGAFDRIAGVAVEGG
ncbi:MAG TPA: histidine ammonia-lyase, partial [Thalassobaculum sp.]